MGRVFDCALCGVCEYSHDDAPHDFRYPDQHEFRLSGIREAIRICETAETTERAIARLTALIQAESDKSAWAWTSPVSE